MPHRLQLRARPMQIYVYSGRTVLVTSATGWITEDGSDGLFVDNTRVLSRDRLVVNDRPPKLIAASPIGADRSLTYYELEADGEIERRTIVMELARSVGDGLLTRLRISNYGLAKAAPVSLDLTWSLAADFIDADDAERNERRVVPKADNEWDAANAKLTFRGEADGFTAQTVVTATGGNWAWDGSDLRCSLEIRPRTSLELTLSAEVTVG